MKRIYKYPVPPTREVTIKLPVGANILAFQVQRDLPCIWAMVDDNADVFEERQFLLLGTGHPIDKIPKNINLHYIGTVQQGGILVWHLFEKVKL